MSVCLPLCLSDSLVFLQTGCGAMRQVSQVLWFLLLANGAWCRSAVGGCVLGCDCRAELRFTVCSRGGFSHLPLPLPPPTELLDLSHNRLTLIPPHSFSSLRRLRVLLLSNNSIRVVQYGAFSLLEYLQRLDLSRNRISTLREGFSLGLTSLRHLQLAHNLLTRLHTDSFLHLDSLQRLNLSNNAIASIQTRAFSTLSSLRQLQLGHNRLTALPNGIFSMLRSLELLGLEDNLIQHTDDGVFTPLTSLALLDLASNRLRVVSFKTFLSLHTYSTHILLEGNPWVCDCDLQRVFRKLRSVQRLFLDDYGNLSCGEPAVLQGYTLGEVDTELCVAETVTVLIITVTVLTTVLAAMVMAERKRKRKKRGRHWTQQGEGSDESDYS